jgi:hypothetical protein
MESLFEGSPKVNAFFLIISVSLLGLTAAVHSLLGERRLLRPLLRKTDPGQTNVILNSTLGRFLIRFAWHLTSLSWLVLAASLLTLQFQPEQALRNTLVATGVVFTAAGIFDAFGSKGRHIGWPLLTAIGIAALMATI